MTALIEYPNVANHGRVPAGTAARHLRLQKSVYQNCLHPIVNILVRIEDLRKVYKIGEVTFEALKSVSLDISTGDFIAVMGHSGSGKSTLLHLVGGLDQPTGGTVRLNGQTLNSMDETALAKFRRSHIGFVFQFFNLIDNLTVQANVELPALLVSSKDKKAIRNRSNQLFKRLGIIGQANKHPWELSGGQQQRVAIARALINTPVGRKF